jgi:D-arabinose 1-dehydrogenase-like Zn-dependent alcohol dehydrogenase
MVNILYTSGNGVFEEAKYSPGKLDAQDIHVRAVMTGVCRSDIAMMNGDFGPLPIHMQGHEGLAQVMAVGSGVSGVQPGDYVATRGEPAYADEYHVKPEQWVVVPAADPKWILEPVACGVNCVLQARHAIALQTTTTPLPRACIIGSGFLAKIVLQTFRILHPDISVDVIGKSNEEWFGDNGAPLLIDFDGTYDIIVDLKEDDRVFNTDCINENAIIIMATEKPAGIDTTLANMLWKAVTMIFPSPRAPTFYEAMVCARNWQLDGKLVLDNFWDRSYNRTTEWQQAFEDANNRVGNYGRGYIQWD